MRKPFSRARRMSAVLAGGLVLAIASGYLTPAQAADPVPLSEAEIADVLFGAAVRLKDSGPAYHRSVVLTAELLDWRAANPAADQPAVAAHMAAVAGGLDAALTETDRALPGAELLGRQLQVLYTVPGAVVTGERTTGLLDVATAKDLAAGVDSIDQRLSGAQQRYALDIAYADAQQSTWLALRKKVGADADTSVATTWKNELGKPTAAEPAGADPKWTFEDFASDALQLSKLVDVKELKKAADEGSEEFWTELREQFEALQTKLTGEQSKLTRAIEDLLSRAGVPGKPGERGPTPAQIAQAKKDLQERQEIIDGAKAGLDAIVWIAERVDEGFAKRLAVFTETVYQLATALNKLYTAIATLAVSTGMGAATFGYIGAIIGAVIGLAQIIFSWGSGDDAAAKNEQHEQLLRAMANGFRGVQQSFETLYEAMNDRFDRVDAGLSRIYRDMMSHFQTVISLLHDVRADVRRVHTDLLALESKVQAFNFQLISQVSDANKTEFLNAANLYVDYEFQNNTPLPNYESGGNDYVTGVNRFDTTATSTARNANFTWADLTSSEFDAAVDAHGPLGAVDYLAVRAAAYGLTVPRSASRVPNADLWAAAARAYTLTAAQNPRFAAIESSARADRILAAGRQIRDTAAAFSTPVGPPASGAWTATNPLYTGLLAENDRLRAAFAESLPDLEEQVMVPDRRIRLWSGQPMGASGPPPAEMQPVDVDKMSVNPTDGAVNKLRAVPAQATRCSDNSRPTKVPDAVTGRNLPRPLLLGLYADASYSYRVCWTNPRWSAAFNEKRREFIGGGNGHPPAIVWHHSRHSYLIADFQEWVDVTGQGRVLGRATTTKRKVLLCSWDSRDEFEPVPDDCPANGGNAADKVATLSLGTFESTTSTATAGIEEARALLDRRRAAYYTLVANRLRTNALPSARALDSSMRRLQAYTAVGFPRALENDEMLRALLHGGHGLPNNLSATPLLQAVFLQAAENARARKSGGVEQPLLDAPTGSCVPIERLYYEDDPVASCLLGEGRKRSDELRYRYEVHSKALHLRQEVQTLPLVDEAIRNLELVREHAARR
ncbi:hypothetical protein [Spirilliplanes yamanashiensis]|uniref:Uncharacterized protein n=1 Tax=Spirilliplanes yamanashiensis TaxID=42233 RepID=A0A8J4DGH9_9ACTN|nr:hypothetical protein [Spirilliplanes yamanashiensis]MDP9814330.1 hypothetical protein [Spirilliplanes yamanashiensis]GIJ00688.1 hypothetical protein Sya03_00400 [Spirilliplanes yamanashiensis]